MRTTLTAAAMLAAASIAHADTVIKFDDGQNMGWSINGLDTVTPTGGNPNGRIHWNDPIDTFGLEIRTSTNTDFIGDYSGRGPVELSIDVDVNYIQFFGQDVSRDLIVQFRDYDNAGSYPYVSVWTHLGTLQGGQGWQTYSAIIDDPTATDLPAGWFGTGDENEFGEPFLPANRSFADVLASVDEVMFTTYVPGFFYGFTNFDLSVDNIAIRTVPTPSAAALFGIAGIGALRRRR